MGVMEVLWNQMELVAPHVVNGFDAAELFKMVNFMVYESHFNLKNGKRKQRIFFKLNNTFIFVLIFGCAQAFS